MKIKYLLFFSCLIAFLSGSAQSYNLQQGIDALKLSDYDKALDYLSRELKDNPKEALAYFYRASVYNKKDQDGSALSDINHAISYSHSKDKKWLPDAYLLRGNIYLKIQSYAKTFQDFKSALKIAPDNVDLYIGRAQIYFDLNQYQNAEADYREILKLDEGDVRAWDGLGRNLYFTDQFAESEDVLNRLIKLSPDYSVAFYHRSMVYNKLKKYDEAINDICNCIALDNTNKDARDFFLSIAGKNYPLAISNVNKQIRLHPGREIWYILRGKLFDEKENFRAAISDYSKAIELTDLEYKSNVLTYRADSYSNVGMYDEAIADLSESISLDSLEAFTYANRGDVQRLKANYKGAIADFTKASEIDPCQAWFYYRRGWTYEIMREFENAINDYNVAITINKDYAYTYLHRGRLYEQQFKNPQKAQKDYNTILELDTSVNSQGNCRQYALFHLGKIEESKDWMNKILLKYPTKGNYYEATCIYAAMQAPTKAIEYLGLAFKNGYVNFNHLAADDDMDNIRQLPEYEKLVKDWKTIHEDAISADEKILVPKTKIKLEKISFPMKPKGSGLYEIPCKINDLTLKMIFDTGASNIFVSQTEVQFMLKNGFLDADDVLGSQKFRDANGDIESGTKIIFRKVDIGGIVLKNVNATVVNNKNAPLLFGQSALSKYGKIEIDNDNKLISITMNIKK